MYADLHLHTQYSDGTLTPTELVYKAQEKGIKIISVCDHNTAGAYLELQKACATADMTFIRGVELDCAYGELSPHILCYGYNPVNEVLGGLMSYNTDILMYMSVELIRKMSVDYPEISSEEYELFQRTPSHGGWKGADYLMFKGLTDGYPHCMSFYSRYNILPYKPFPDIKTVIDVIHTAKGKAVLAHPGERFNIAPEVFIKTLNELSNMGLDGVECYYPSHSAEFSGLCADFCREHDMLITAGSDDHGEFAKVVRGVTYGLGEILVDHECLNLEGLL